MIDVVGVTQHYGVRPVLRNVSLRVNQGELVALMGPNGMGKSSLMSVVAGLIAPLKGYVEIDGKRRRSSPEDELEIRKKVAYLPAEAWLPSDVTGREWLLGVGRIYEVDDERLMQHADNLLSLFELTKEADSPIRSYSTGQQKKIALSGTLITDAPIMLLDEPFSGGLDPSAILALKSLLLRFAREKRRTILMATPVPELVEELAARVAVLVSGEIVACDTVDGLRKMTNSSGSLDTIYQQIVHPQTLKKIDEYFVSEGARK